MKIISLNAYAGIVFEPLMAFVKDQKETTDVFCFQEVLTTDRDDLVVTAAGNHAKLFQELCELLPEFQGYYTGMLDNVDTSFLTTSSVEGVVFGIATFIRKTIPVESYREVPVLNSRANFDPKDGNTNPAIAQISSLNVDGHTLTVCNIHGTYFPGSKLDTPNRLLQSQNTIAAVQNQPGDKIIVGDFNLLPDTESIRMFEKFGYRNLVLDHKIPSTRGSLNKKLHPEFANGKHGFQEYADYTFVTSGIKVKSFEVPDLPLSDHLPMILEFDL